FSYLRLNGKLYFPGDKLPTEQTLTREPIVYEFRDNQSYAQYAGRASYNTERLGLYDVVGGKIKLGYSSYSVTSIDENELRVASLYYASVGSNVTIEEQYERVTVEDVRESLFDNPAFNKWHSEKAVT